MVIHNKNMVSAIRKFNDGYVSINTIAIMVQHNTDGYSREDTVYCNDIPWRATNPAR